MHKNKIKPFIFKIKLKLKFRPELTKFWSELIKIRVEIPGSGSRLQARYTIHTKLKNQ
jgi:hypothetical protein